MFYGKLKKQCQINRSPGQRSRSEKIRKRKKSGNISHATTDTYKNLKGEKIEDTQWHNLVIWGRLADVAGQYLKKGSEVAIEGKLIHRAYETRSGEKRYITEINVNEMLMLGRK